MPDDAKRPPSRPLTPDPTAMEVAQRILKGRIRADHKDYNALLAAGREQGLPIEWAYFGPRAVDAKSVIDEVADQNLRSAPLWKILRRIACLNGRIAKSVASSMRGVAGRQQHEARASEGRIILRVEIARLEREIARRASIPNAAAATGCLANVNTRLAASGRTLLSSPRVP